MRKTPKYTPKFSGCGFYAIPQNQQEFDEMKGTFDRVEQMREFEKFEKGNTHQDQTLKYYKNLEKSTQTR